MENTQDLQSRVVATRPETTVPVVVLRAGEEVTLDVTIAELDLEAGPTAVVEEPVDNLGEGFGISLQDLTPQVSNRLRLPNGTQGAVVVDVESGGSGEASGIQPGDVILRINRVDVSGATETVAQLNMVETGRTAFLLIQRGGSQIFLQVLKE